MLARPLVITADPQVLDDVLRVAATAGLEVDVAADAGAARRSWSAAAAVVVGHDMVRACARLRLPRRDHVVVLGVDLDDAMIWQRAVGIGAAQVVFLPDGEAWLADMLTEAVEPPAVGGAVVAVVGGRGGAGATTLATALALTAAREGRRTLLVDGDPLGGGIDLVLGGEDRSGLRWADLSTTRGRVPGAALLGALPRLGDLSVLSWDRGETRELPAAAMETVVDAGRRSCELVVVDLPRYVDDCFGAVASLADVVLLVVPAEVRATVAAARVAARVAALCGDLRVVVRGPAPSGLSADEVARVLGLPLAASLREEPALAQALEHGEPPGGRGGPLSKACAQLLTEVLVPLRRAA